MNQEQALELADIRREQERLHRAIRRLDDRIETVGQSVSRPAESRAPEAPSARLGAGGSYFRPSSTPPSVPAAADKPVSSRPPAPVPAPGPAAPVKVSRETPAPAAPAPAAEATTPPPPLPPSPPASEPAPDRLPLDETIEMTVGRVWLVRIGIVVLLTGLVFLGNLAYQHIVPRLGPGGKLSLIGLAGGVLAGLGLRLERRGENLRNYARVLLAGGWATLYYTVFAAHFVSALRVIESPVAGGLALLGVAGAMTWVAHRRRSELLALFAVLLSYYTSSLNPVGAFTLFSSLLLAAAAVFFLVRHRWARLTMASLFGTYASFAWWRFYGPGSLAGTEPVWTQTVFLFGYWLIFAAGAFLTSAEAWPGGARTVFAALNNAAFFALGSHAFMVGEPEHFWVFALGFGGLNLGLAAAAAHRFPDDPPLDESTFAQGLALLATGFASKLTHGALAVTFAAQSVILLVALRRRRWLRETAAALSAGAAAFLALRDLWPAHPHACVTAAVVALVLAFDGWWIRRSRPAETSQPVAIAAASGALVLGFAALWVHFGWLGMIPWLVAGAVLGAALPWVIRYRELVLGSQVLLPVAALMCALERDPGALSSILLLGAGWGLACWWPRQSRLPVRVETLTVLAAAPAVSAAVTGVSWLNRTWADPGLMVLAAGVAVGWLGAALAVRSRALAASGLIFLVISVVHFISGHDAASWFAALAPSAALLIVAALTRWLARLGPDAAELARPLRGIFVGAGVGLLLPWSFLYIPEPWLPLFYSAVGAVCVLASRRGSVYAFSGLAFGGVGWLLCLHLQPPPTWQEFAAILLFPAACRVARRFTASEPLVETASVLATATVFLLTFWTIRANYDYHVLPSSTFVWAFLGLGFVGAGLLLRERGYRLGGLGLLGIGVGHVFLVDVWQIEQVFRILSFIALGVVLLLAGYFYNRFEAQIRRWL